MADLRKSRAQALPTWGKAEKRPVAELNPTSAWPHGLVPTASFPAGKIPAPISHPSTCPSSLPTHQQFFFNLAINLSSKHVTSSHGQATWLAPTTTPFWYSYRLAKMAALGSLASLIPVARPKRGTCMPRRLALLHRDHLMHWK